MPTELMHKKKVTLKEIADITISHGAHRDRSNGLCAMELVAWVNGEPHSDHPGCTPPTIAAFIRSWNDCLRTDEERNRILRPLIKSVIGAVNTPEAESRRAWMATDWMIREMTPAWLRLAKLNDVADALAGCPEIKDVASCEAVMKSLLIARDKSAAAWDAAGAAAGAAAVAAAWDAAGAAAGAAAVAAAWDAAGAAAGAAAVAAAWDAAWDAARDAARAAAGAAARDALEPTVKELQQSAIRLIHRMVEVK